MQSTKRMVLIVFLFGIVLQTGILNAEQPPAVEVTSEKIAENIYLLQDSAGMGNTTVLTGNDGILMIDAKVKDSVDMLLQKITELSKTPIRFEVITHWHFDHVEGNEKVAQTGATIIAHENVRKQMSVSHDMKLLGVSVPPSPEAALPLLTYQKELSLHMDGEDVKVFHLGPAHTDGDSIIYFSHANVIHMGDLYFEGLYPFIGIYSGGSLAGMIKAIHSILPMLDEETIVVPGHGPVSDKGQLETYVAMLAEIQQAISKLMAKGMSLDEVVAAKPTKAFDEKWGKGFLSPDTFVGLIYMDLSPDMP